METTVLLIMLLIILYLISTIHKLENRVQNVKHTLDQIAKKMELPEAPINDDLRNLLREGKDVKAIKIARQTLGLSLVEGKRYVDSLKDGD